MVSEIKPPVAPQIAKTLELHGDQRSDPYFWMNDNKDPKVLRYLKAENEYVDAVMKKTLPLQKELFEEMKGRMKQDDSSVPIKDGDYFYYWKFLKGKDYPNYYRKKGSLKAKEQILIDQNKLAKDQKFFHLGAAKPSSDHSYIAYAVDTVGRRFYTIFFKDLKTGKTLEQNIPDTTGNFAWASDGRTIFYSKQDPETLRSDKVLRWDLVSKQSVLVYEEKDPVFDVSVFKTRTKKFILIDISSKDTSEVRLGEAYFPTNEFKVFYPRQKGHEYDIEDGGDRFFIRTNWNAQNFRLMESSLENTLRDNWKEVIPHRTDVFLVGFDSFQNYLTLSESQNALTNIRVINRKSEAESFIQFKDPVYIVSTNDNYEFNSETLRFVYESMKTPMSVIDYNMKTKKQVVKKQQEVLGGFKSSNYISERLWATASDGVKVPISILYKKGTSITDSKSPLFVEGYGSYGISFDPEFNSNILSLVDRGFVYAIAHIRGGSDMGRAWYENGKFLKKKNTFTDFIAATEFLQKKGYSSPERTFAYGASAGGLLMGAIANMRPDLYKGILAGVPFVDVLTTMLDASIPLTTQEYDEWGNPEQKPFYDYIKSYSPYDNVKAQAYPNIFVKTGFHDSQVQYWEPAKWIAKLRKMNTSKNLILFKTDFTAGHGGKMGRFTRLHDKALEYAFVLKFL